MPVRPYPVALAALVGCGGPGPDEARPDPPPVTEAPPAEEDAPTVSVRVAVRPGVRDLVASAIPAHPDALPVALSWAWTVDGAATGHHGPRIPADEVWPGQTWTVTVTPSAGGAVGKPASATVTVPEPPGGNAIVVMLDDVGVDKLDAYGLNPLAPPTPTIDALAAEGVTFTNAYTAPTCSPTRALFLTGRYGRRTGSGWIVDMDDSDWELPLEAWTLPEALGTSRGAAPWTSSAVGKWHLAGYDAPSGSMHPLLSGFPWYAGSLGYLIVGAAVPPVDSYFVWRKSTNGVDDLSWVYNTTDTIDDALARVQAMPEPFFLFVSLNAAHTPLHVPPQGLHTWPVTDDSPEPDLHRAMLEAADTELGRFLASIDPDVLARSTIVLTADNGTQTFTVDPPFDPARAKGSVYEGGVRVPLVVAGPHVTAPGEVSDALVHLVDLFPTIADLAGVPLTDHGDGLAVVLPDGAARPIDGRSLLPLLADPGAPHRDLLYAEHFLPNGPGPYAVDQRTIRDHRYKLVRKQIGDELYEIVPGAVDEGDDLLAGAPTVEQLDAYVRLATALEALGADLVFEGF